MLLVTSHAVNRYRERSGEGGKDLDSRVIRNVIIEMANSPDSLKFLSGGRILVCGDWILIQAENRIVTLYKGEERDIVRKKIRGKRNAENFDADDGDSAWRKKPASRLDRIKSLLRGGSANF